MKLKEVKEGMKVVVVATQESMGGLLKKGDVGVISEICDYGLFRVNTKTITSSNWCLASDVELVGLLCWVYVFIGGGIAAASIVLLILALTALCN